MYLTQHRGGDGVGDCDLPAQKIPDPGQSKRGATFEHPLHHSHAEHLVFVALDVVRTLRLDRAVCTTICW